VAHSNDTLLSVSDLRTHFRTDDGVVKAVDGISFCVGRGEILAIVGESGSGKTVSSLSIMGLIAKPPGFFPSGSIQFDGVDLLHANEKALRQVRGNRISMIFQDPMTSLNPYLTIERQLTEVLELHQQMSRRDAVARATQMLERVGISEPSKRIKNHPHEFSGGMRQRVMIAMALLCKPDLLIADEPTTALDVTIQAQILELILELKNEFDTGVILITHDLGVVAGMADRVNVMYAGRIVEAGTTDEIFTEPRHPYTQGLLRSIPRLDQDRKKRLEAIAGLPPNLSALPPGCAFEPRCDRAVGQCKKSYPTKTAIGTSHYVHCPEATHG